MDYAHVITLAAPKGLWDAANALALVIGDQPGDDRTFTGANAQSDAGDRYCVIHARFTERAYLILTGEQSPDAPDHSPSADLDAASAALDLISTTGPARADAISMRIDADLADALDDLGLEWIEPDPVVLPQTPERAAQLVDLIRKERDRRLIANFEFQGVSYQRDPISVQRIAGAAQLASLAIMAGAQPGDLHWHGRDTPFGWITADDDVTFMDAMTVIDFGRAAAARETELIFAARALRLLDPIPEDFADDKWWP